MNAYVLGFQAVDKTKLMAFGGKGANLGELSRIGGVRVPEGFCVTTAAYQRIMAQTPEVNALVAELTHLRVDDREGVGVLSGRIRQAIETAVIPAEIEAEIAGFLTKLGETTPYAVRSSATAEDLPTASFAGQQDTYLNIIGKTAILRHIGKCWASLFTDRAVIYRMQNGFDHHKVYLAVVVQKMVFPQAAGILFTADPVTANRKVLSIDAGFGLGEALVSGLVNPDIYKVRDGKIIDKNISAKKLAIYAAETGGTEQREIEAARQEAQVLTDEKILALANIGRKLEAYFTCPQDVEWCLAGDEIHIVQSRPITTLYPVPEMRDDKNHVYLSFGHRQMMTDAMKPLGLSFFQVLFRQMGVEEVYEAGGRLYMDISKQLSSPLVWKPFIKSVDKVDVLMQNALYKLMKRQDFIKGLAHGIPTMGIGTGMVLWVIQAIKYYRRNDPAIVRELMAKNALALRDLEQKIAGVSGNTLFDLILEGATQFKHSLFAGYGVVFAGTYAADWLNKNMEKWLGEKNAAATLSQSVANNVTSEMGLELLDVADIVRQYPAVITYLEQARNETFFADLQNYEGGKAVSEAIQAYLKKYGMRCSAEIDITRPRWAEKPVSLVPMILSNIKNFPPHSHARLFEQGRQEAAAKERELITRLEQFPGGEKKARKAEKMISVLRNYAGYREYGKYVLVCFYWIVKQALLHEAARLVRNGVLREADDIYYLSFEELRDVVGTNKADSGLIARRKAEFETYAKLTPPRVMTSEGEIISGEYATDNIPPGALAGVAVSAGIIEGRARIVLRMEDAHIEAGDILVTTFTDPSWTPVFVSIKGLVTEVGGMMTHGAVVAREYGLPAVVGVEDATGKIRDGQRIRVNGSEGYVELL